MEMLMAKLFKDFDVSKFMNKKPYSDNSFDTMREIKELVKIPANDKFVKEKDDIFKSFKKTAAAKNVDFPAKLVNNLITQSAPVLIKIKKKYNRPRPKVLAKKLNIKLKDIEMSSMETSSYPSGHSAQGVLIGNVLADMFPGVANSFKKTGKDISRSRNIAKAHYKSDSTFGEEIGIQMYKHLKK